MTHATAQAVSSITRIDHTEAMAIATVENAKFGEHLRRLTEADWSKPTDCALWNVHDLCAHLVGSAASQASPREFFRQKRKGKPYLSELGSPYWWDGMNQLQVQERQDLTPAELIAEWDATSVRAVKARTGMPRPLAGLRLLKLPAPVGRQPLAYLFDVGFTRDVWAHRIDLARATGTDLDLDADHDGRLLADLVAEWATTHGEPFVLELGGPAGGNFSAGENGEHLTMDAVDFVRVLAERAEGTGILQHSLPL